MKSSVKWTIFFSPVIVKYMEKNWPWYNKLYHSEQNVPSPFAQVQNIEVLLYDDIDRQTN